MQARMFGKNLLFCSHGQTFQLKSIVDQVTENSVYRAVVDGTTTPNMLLQL